MGPDTSVIEIQRDQGQSRSPDPLFPCRVTRLKTSVGKCSLDFPNVGCDLINWRGALVDRSADDDIIRPRVYRRIGCVKALMVVRGEPFAANARGSHKNTL